MTKSHLHYKNLLSELENAIKASEQKVVLVAPFIKHSIVELLLHNLSDKINLTVYTRWRLDEILSGVSDIEIWELIRNHDNSSLFLSPNLHAKYYRFDNTILLGSANLTSKALVSIVSSNLELLQRSQMSKDFLSFEKTLASKSIRVNDELYEQVKEIVNQNEEREFVSEVNELGINYNVDDSAIEKEIELNQWLPKTRNPENLFIYYSGDFDLLTSEQINHAKYDLSYFPISNGLSKKEFNETISFYLLQTPIIQKIDAFLNKDRRFGEMAGFLEKEFNLKENKKDPKRCWQTLMRWLKHFFPFKYLIRKSNYSEIFCKRQFV